MDAQQLQAELDGAVARWNVPGAAVGLLASGREVYAYSGVTSVENPLPVDEGTLFQFGSTGKTFTATAIMRLVDEGRVELDAPVRRYLPELVLRDEETAAEVEVLQLLNHTAGWAGDRMDDTGEGDDALSRYLELMRDFPQLTPLGSVVSYNNASYSLAGRLIEKVTGKLYERAIEELLFEPLGLTSSLFFLNDIMTRRFAVGHLGDPDGGVNVARPWKMPRSANPGGGISANAEDLIAWARFHMGDGLAPSGERVLSTESLKSMQEPTADMRGSALGDYVGIGWLLREVDGVRMVGHGGSTIGQHSQLTMIPEREFAVIVLTNCGPSGVQMYEELTRTLLEACAGVVEGDPVPIAADEATLSRYAGRYETPVSFCDVVVEDGQLVLRMSMKDEELARLDEAGEAAPPEPPPATLGLLPGAAHRYVMTSGPAEGMKGYFASDPTGEIVGLHAGGRMATRVGVPGRG